MTSTHSHQTHSHPPETGHTAVVNRVADDQWHALEDDLVVGRGDAARRPDGRRFISVDAWHDTVFDQLVAVMAADLPAPLHTVVDEADHELTAAWRRAGFTVRRREWEYLVPTDPRVTGLDQALPASGVTVLPAGAADEDRLRALDRAVRDEIEAAGGWQSMPAERPGRPGAGPGPLDLSQYAVAVRAGEYVGLVRVGPVIRQARIGLVAVRAGHRRHGVARALLTHALSTLHQNGIASAWAEVDESNAAAVALVEGVGARRATSSLELVRR